MWPSWMRTVVGAVCAVFDAVLTCRLLLIALLQLGTMDKYLSWVMTCFDPAPFAYQTSFLRLAMGYSRLVLADVPGDGFVIAEREDLKVSLTAIGHVGHRGYDLALNC